MTKITDLPGAKEALPITHHDFKGEGWFCHNDMSNVHLEVDVGAMATLINNFEYRTALPFKDCKSSDLAKYLSETTSKWARLVRK